MARILNPPCPERLRGRVAIASTGTLEVEFSEFIQPSTLLQIQGNHTCFLGEVLSCSPLSSAVYAFSTVIRIEDCYSW